ncbi:MAG TPA: hypothetical protein DHW49_06385 [Anaerolineae bacterium]|nr:hypothetical protein [Anaerolineae bacterium]
MSKIHVFQVAKSSGGVGSYVRRLVRHINKDRFQITVACLSEGAEEMVAELSQIPGVNAFSIPMEHHISVFSDLYVVYRLYKTIRKEKFDLIHAHTSKPGFFVRLAAIGTRIPIIYRPANFSFYDGVSKWRIALYVLLERFAARYLTERLMFVSSGEREMAKDYKVGVDAQFTLIRTGINVREFEPTAEADNILDKYKIPADAKVVGTVARLVEDKAPFDFLLAAKLVHDQYPNAHFVWVGDGPLENDLYKKVKEFDLQDVFHLVGYQSNVKGFLQAMDIFVLSSTSEGLSISMLEAMASGLPVISTLVNGADETIRDGETGFLVPIGDSVKIGEAILKLLSVPSFMQEMGRRAREHIRNHFSFEEMINKIESLYEEIYNSKLEN